MIGRRVASIAEITQPGDYCGPLTGYTGDKPAVFFLLPNSRDEDAPPAQRSLHHVISPPHVFRECNDGSLEVREGVGHTGRGSLEIRESIGAMPFWHGYLDEGHVWRSV